MKQVYFSSFNLIIILFLSGIINAQANYSLAEENPFDPVSLSNIAAPALGDIDNDGDLDLFVGQYNSNNMLFYRNTGNADEPVYEQQFEDDNPLDVYSSNSGCNSPFLVDIDADGDIDAFVGTWNGIIRYYRNDGSADSSDFRQYFGEDNPLGFISTTGICSFASFIDIDADGDLDAFVGDGDGNIEYFVNEGDHTIPEFARDSINNPFNDFSFESRVKLAFEDIDGDELYDAIIAHDADTPELLFYKNTGTSMQARFEQSTESQNPFNNITGSMAILPAFADIDNDGDKDLVLGERGQVQLYEASELSSSIERTESFDQILIYPNPSSGIVNIESDKPFTYQILSSSGIEVKKAGIKESIFQFNFSQLQKGMYYMTIKSANGIYTKKLIIQ